MIYVSYGYLSYIERTIYPINVCRTTWYVNPKEVGFNTHYSNITCQIFDSRWVMNLYLVLVVLFLFFNFTIFFSRHFKNWSLVIVWASLAAQTVENPPSMQETLSLIPGSGRSAGEGDGKPLQCSCLENSHGQRSLAGYSPWGHKEADTTGHLSTA